MSPGRLETIYGLVLGAVCLSAVCLCTAMPARADFEICNNTSYILRAAIGLKDGGEQKTKGWWHLFPGDCRKVIKGNLNQSNYYTYAESDQAHKEGLKYFGGDRDYCVGEKVFEVVGNQDCEARGFRTVKFVRVKVGRANDWTAAFTETAEFDSKRARIAGVQRLLKDLGYLSGAIDGFFGRKSRAALASFRQQEGLQPFDEVDDDLYKSLEVALKRDADKVGYNLCNQTGKTVWAAIGFMTSDKDWQSQGWWKLDDGSCARPIREALTDQEYYLYAVVPGSQPEGSDTMVTRGGFDMCIADARFDIVGRDNCSLRGYDTVPFEKIETNGAKLVERTLSLDKVTVNPSDAAARPNM